MYKPLLILRYLRRKLAPLFAAMAVTLCTAMVIIVISVMGGFLELMRDATQRLTGQVTVRADLTGFPGYEELMADIEARPEVAAATSIIRAYGLVNLHNRVMTVEVMGIDGQGLDAVTGYRETLYWTNKHLLEELEASLPSWDEMDQRERAYYESQKQLHEKINLRDLGIAFTPPRLWNAPPDAPQTLPGIVPGIEVSPYNYRDDLGQYDIANSSLNTELTLTVLPLTQRGTVMEPSVRRMMVANEFKSGLYEVDANRVFVPLALLQKMLRMDPSPRVNFETGEPTGEMEPGRVTEIMIRGQGGVALESLYETVMDAVRAFENEHPGYPPLSVQTWQQRHAMLLGAVEKEKFLLTILFAIISLVAVAMIGVIFYMIVLEKTHDIGVLRAIGASRGGVMTIFLGYGLAIGCLGAVMGLGLAAAVVYNINEIQELLTEYFHFTMWDRKQYYFDKVPSQLDAMEVAVILAAAVLSSVLGSLLPAYLAGRLNPVESLRYE